MSLLHSFPSMDAMVLEWLDAFAAGMYLLFGSIHLDLWLKRRDRASHLWLAMASGGALLVDLTALTLRHSDRYAPVLLALNILGVVAVTSSLYELVRSLSNARPTRIAHLTYGTFAALGMTIGYLGLERLAPPFMLACAAVLLAAMVRAIRDARAGDRESRAIAGGLVVLVLCLVADITFDIVRRYGVPKIPGLPILGFATLFIISSRALNERHEREHGELIELRDELEERVRERTRQLEEVNQQLAEVSRTDALTGLPNRRAFLEAGEHELHRAIRAGQQCSVVMVDLDHFKQINDRHGHAGGDALLRAAASCLRAVLRGEDVVARWGGEEFVLLLPNTDRERAIIVAEKARAALAATEFEQNEARESITGSFGVATHRSDRSLDATIAAADLALYRAKESGRNCVISES